MAIMQNTLNYWLPLHFNRFPRCVLSTEKREKKVRIVAYSFYEEIPTASPVPRIGRPTPHERNQNQLPFEIPTLHHLARTRARRVVNFCCDKKQIARTVKIVPKIDLPSRDLINNPPGSDYRIFRGVDSDLGRLWRWQQWESHFISKHQIHHTHTHIHTLYDLENKRHLISFAVGRVEKTWKISINYKSMRKRGFWTRFLLNSSSNREGCHLAII